MSAAEPLIVTPLAHSRERLSHAQDATEAARATPSGARDAATPHARSAQGRRAPDMSAYYTYTDRTSAPTSGASRESTGTEAGFAQATAYERTGTTGSRPRRRQSRIAGAVQFAGGVACMAIGVPLLILPGPGLAMIAGGAVLATRGASSMLGKKRVR